MHMTQEKFAPLVSEAADEQLEEQFILALIKAKLEIREKIPG